MYSTILSDGRLRDLVNGHSLAPPLHSDAAWSTTAGALVDGSSGFGLGPSRASAGMLGAEGARNVFGDLAIASPTLVSSEKETLDIRSILSNPLPPLPSDVDFVRSQASTAAAGTTCAQFDSHFFSLFLHFRARSLFIQKRAKRSSDRTWTQDQEQCQEYNK
jgi:hypothetical protein